MNGHLMHRLLALYPRAFRDRYGAELASVTDELIRAGEITPLLAVVNLIWGAALEWGRVLFYSRRAVRAMAVAAIIAVAGSLYVTSHAQPQGTQASAPAGYSVSSRCMFWAKAPFSVIIVPSGKARNWATVGGKTPAKPGPFWFVVPQTGPLHGKLSGQVRALRAALQHASPRPGPACPSVRMKVPLPGGWTVRSAPEWITLKPSS